MGYLTKKQYEEIALSLKFSQKALIDGRLTDSHSGRKFITYNPANGKELAEITCCDEKDVDTAVRAARKAFEDKRWAGLKPGERREILQKFAALIMENQDELAVMESLDSGKPIFDTAGVDVPESAATFIWHAEAIDKLEDQITTTGPNNMGLVVREPIGVVGAIVPWNFPMLMASWKLAPILATGNSVIVKPAKLTSLTLLKMAELSLEAGIPEGVFNVLPGEGSKVGTAIAMHPDVDLLTFTGSTEVGRKLLEYSGKSNLKRVLLELGGKNPAIIMPDVADLDNAAEQCAAAAFWNMGENCTANSRIYVHKSIKEKFLEKLIEKTLDWKVGNPLDCDIKQGPLIERPHMEKVLGYIEKGRAEGAKLVRGGNQIFKETGGCFVEPAIFDNVTQQMTIAREEIFGPVAAVLSFEDTEDVIRMANDTEYGLHASVWTNDVNRVHKLTRAIRAGTISVNCYSEGDITTPFGGYKSSGFFGRDKSLWANRQYTEMKTIWMEIK
jgi:gamma-glutamyl-gamma-aminobutyraldehyde dehydrogenase